MDSDGPAGDTKLPRADKPRPRRFRPSQTQNSNEDNAMKNMTRRSLNTALAIAALTTTVFAAKEKTLDQLLADLASPKDTLVAESLLALEKKHPDAARTNPAVRKLLTDPREKVRRKAARVLG